VSPTKYEFLEVDGREVRISNPDKVYFPTLGKTKLDLVNYYLSVMPGALRGGHERPTSMYRWPDGVDAPDDAFFQKRIPAKGTPEWVESAVIKFPSGRSAQMPLIHVIWMVNLGCIDFNPWPVRRADLDHPDELRVDLDPTPGIPFEHVRLTALLVKDVLEEHGLKGWPKTSGKRGIHIYVRTLPEYDFTEVRRAALALAREVERRSDGMATTAWWKEERTGVFVDYNQNARDRTIASAYSVRPQAAAQVSTPLRWDEVAEVEMEAFTIDTVPPRLEAEGDPWADIDEAPASLDPLLELARRDEEGGLGDAPWPPHFPKQKGEPKRVQPSKARDD
jgi:DNA ligase D-like protein (predicted polymerase)